MDQPESQLRAALDGTLYWTLSFYISREQMTDPGLVVPLGAQGLRHFAEKDAPPGIPERFDACARAQALVPPRPAEGADAAVVQAYAAYAPTARLRAAIEPLFNDIADRSRLGRVEDHIFAAAPAMDIAFIMPAQVQWTTEGQDYCVPTIGASQPDASHPDAARPRFAVHGHRFWYLHGNGALSWHVSFALHYRDAAFEHALNTGQAPVALYLLSLMQKLAYPKELKLPEGVANPRSDDMVGVRILDTDGQEKHFWDAVERWFNADKSLVADIHPAAAQQDFDSLCPVGEVNEVPGLRCHETRSQIFIHDEEFFKLIQPKDANGDLVERRTRVKDSEFAHYPGLIRRHADSAGSDVILGPRFWQAANAPLPGQQMLSARERLLYLFLAGFNQNIIDWMNQDASEVLDSLDPIYPQSEEQLEEGFFIRFANPRCMISYVQRSRTLEVGNDYVGTCPYALLIHVLAMHNERLTRDQEKLAFAVVEKVNGLVRDAETKSQAGARGVGALVQQAERWINWYRMAAFEMFDRHRYTNPFRYDTESSVFSKLEHLRGTSRLATTLDKAFEALEESARDLERVRAEAEREREREADAREREADAREQARDRKLGALFGLIGLAGVGQLAFNIDAFLFDDRFRDGIGVADVAPMIALTLGFGAAIMLAWQHFRKS